VHDAVSRIPTEVRERLETAKKLSDEDRAAILAVATSTLAEFRPTISTTGTMSTEPTQQAPTVSSDDRP
jgi:hypothetical protein